VPSCQPSGVPLQEKALKNHAEPTLVKSFGPISSCDCPDPLRSFANGLGITRKNGLSSIGDIKKS
jgi:hypothetical protein